MTPLVNNFFNKKTEFAVVLLTDFCVFQSAKTNLNVEQVFFSIARDIKQRLAETDSKPEVQTTVHSYALHSTIHRVQCSERYMLAL